MNNDSFSEYLTKVDERLVPYIGSGDFVDIIKGETHKRSTEALSFGTHAHAMIEAIIETPQIPYETKLTPANLKKMNNIRRLITPYIERNNLREKNHYTESNCYVSAEAVKEEASSRLPKLHSCFRPLVNAIATLNRGIKCRPDYLYYNGGTLLIDWKTTTKTTLDDIYGDVYGMRYVLKMCFYCVALGLGGLPVSAFKLVMIPKLESGGRIVEVMVDIDRDASRIHGYLETAIGFSWEKQVSRWKNIRHNRAVIKTEFFGGDK